MISLFFTAESFSQNKTTDTINQLDDKGQKQGYWKKYRNDTLLYTGNFKNNIPVGEFNYFYPDKKIKAKSVYSENGKSTDTKMFFKNGVLKAEGKYINKKKEACWKYFNIRKVLIAEEYYENGKGIGVWKSYFADGELCEEVEYKNGKKDGFIRQYFGSGVLKYEAIHKDGKLNGPVRTYWLNKKLLYAGTYRNSIKIGLWYYYDREGAVVKKEKFVNGKPRKIKIDKGNNE